MSPALERTLPNWLHLTPVMAMETHEANVKETPTWDSVPHIGHSPLGLLEKQPRVADTTCLSFALLTVFPFLIKQCILSRALFNGPGRMGKFPLRIAHFRQLVLMATDLEIFIWLNVYF